VAVVAPLRDGHPGVTLGWLADRNDAQVLEALDGFAGQLAAFAEPANTPAALPG